MEQFEFQKADKPKVGEAKRAEIEFRQSFATKQEDIELRDKLYSFLHEPKRRGGLFEYLGLEASDEEISFFIEATDLCLRHGWVSGLAIETEDQKRALDFLIQKAGERESRAA